MSLSVWVPAEVDFFGFFDFFGFSGKIVAHQELFCVVTPLAYTQCNCNDDKNEKNQSKSCKSNWFNKQNKNCEIHHTFWKISLPSLHNYSHIVELDWNGICVILALISKIVASSIVMLVTFISLEIPIQRINHRLAKILETVFGIVNQKIKDLNTCEVPVGIKDLIYFLRKSSY